jgi:hypothetical protein
VNQEEGKLQTNYYLKLAEALALPVLALVNSVLPMVRAGFWNWVTSMIRRAQ